jgi:hypothetical protein
MCAIVIWSRPPVMFNCTVALPLPWRGQMSASEPRAVELCFGKRAQRVGRSSRVLRIKLSQQSNVHTDMQAKLFVGHGLTLSKSTEEPESN